MATAASIKANCRKVICIGRNYADHITELKNATPSSPFFFLKPPSSILLPGEGPIRRPRGIDMHHEVELGLVIGKHTKDLAPTDEVGAMSAIQHYLLAIDMTARNLQAQNKKAGLPWTMAKGFDTFCPISEPWLPSVFPLKPLPQESGAGAGTVFPSPYDAHLVLSESGKTRQSDGAELMLFKIPRMLSDISSVMTLEPGDIVLTGTPKGVAPLVGGQKVEIECRLGAGGEPIPESKVAWDIVDADGLYEFKE